MNLDLLDSVKFVYFVRTCNNQRLISQLEEEGIIIRYNLSRLNQMITKVSILLFIR